MTPRCMRVSKTDLRTRTSVPPSWPGRTRNWGSPLTKPIHVPRLTSWLRHCINTYRTYRCRHRTNSGGPDCGQAVQAPDRPCWLFGCVVLGPKRPSTLFWGERFTPKRPSLEKMDRLVTYLRSLRSSYSRSQWGFGSRGLWFRRGPAESAESVPV